MNNTRIPFTVQVPMTLLDLVSDKQISPASLAVYFFLKTTADVQGALTINRYQLSQISGLSVRSISIAKRELTKQFKSLGNMPLITIESVRNLKKKECLDHAIPNTEYIFSK